MSPIHIGHFHSIAFAFEALEVSQGERCFWIALVHLLNSQLPHLEHLLDPILQEVNVPLRETGGKIMDRVEKGKISNEMSSILTNFTCLNCDIFAFSNSVRGADSDHTSR